MAEKFDFVVASAGHNSLIAAAYLAKAGYRCLVLEGRPTVGGGVKSAHLTLRGFTHDVCSSAHNGIHGNPMLLDDEVKLGDLTCRWCRRPSFQVAFLSQHTPHLPLPTLS
jgi:phytoene dehydrogenase-like protein